VVGMSDVVHIITKYMEELREGHNRFDALVKTIREAGFATFLTLLTTAVGFLALINSSIKPVNDFGIYTSIGVFVAFFLAYAIMPVVLNSLRTPSLKLNEETSQFWNDRLHRLLAWVFRNSKWIGWGTVVITAISIVGVFQIRLNNYLIEGLMRGDSLRDDFVFFENHYAGVRPFEMIIKPKNTNDSVLSPASLRAIDKLENFLRTDYGVGFVITPATFVKAANKGEQGGAPEAYRLPETDSAITALVDELSDVRRMKETRDFITKRATMGRISGKMHDIGSVNIRVLNARLDSFLQRTPEMKTLDCRITGGAAMLDKDNEYLVSNMMQGLALSVLAVALIIALIHRSWRLVIISIVPNIVPIFIIGGAMGFFGVDLKSSTSIIFSIAFGIATDDTIHFLARLRLEQLKGKSLIYAVKRTFISTGKAVVVTSLILSAGFLTLVASGFESTFYFGLLVSVTLLIAVLADLLLFPLLCVWLLHEKKDTAASEIKVPDVAVQ
jgi:predicted RND superfamily exporter protein